MPQERWGEAAEKLAQLLDDDTFRSLEGKSKHALWLELCDIIVRHPKHVEKLDVDVILRGGIRKFTDEVGVAGGWLKVRLWGLGLNPHVSCACLFMVQTVALLMWCQPPTDCAVRYPDCDTAHHSAILLFRLHDTCNNNPHVSSAGLGPGCKLNTPWVV